MKRLLLASALIVGALFLALGATSSTSVAAAPPPSEDYCGVEGFNVPDYGQFFNFTNACASHDECWYFAADQTDLFVCDQRFLADMQASCEYAPSGTVGTLAPPPSQSFFGKAICRQIALYYYYGVRIASPLHIFTQEPVTCGTSTGSAAC